jgi:transcriptional regulator with GAF, ATPase, and Fis domain
VDVEQDAKNEQEVPVADGVPGDVLAKLATIVLAEETLDSVLSKVVELTKQVITAADEVSLTLVRRGRAETAAYTGIVAMQADERQYGLDSGPCLDAGRGGEVLHIRDMRTESRWPAYAAQAASIGILSSLSIPLPIQEDLIGALNVYSRFPESFDDDDVRAGQTFAAYARHRRGQRRQLRQHRGDGGEPPRGYGEPGDDRAGQGHSDGPRRDYRRPGIRDAGAGLTAGEPQAPRGGNGVGDPGAARPARHHLTRIERRRAS